MLDTNGPYTGLLALLVEERLLTASAAARIEKGIRESWTPLGTILVRLGHMTMGDLATLLEMQSYEPQLRLGDLAVREGYCTQRGVEKAVRVQLAASPPPPEVLLSEIPGDRERLCRVLLRYIGQMEARLAELQVAV